MAEVKKIATRESYGKALKEFGADERVIVLDADLSKSTKTATFKDAYPERHFNAGIAEANMTSVAAGLASCGKVVFSSSFAMFASGRAFEQIRNSVCYPKLNVKIGATHAGISVGEDGATHQCNEDIAIMRSLPNMTIVNPADDIEARLAVKAAIETDGPFYLRFGRLAVDVVNDESTYKFELGKGVELKPGKDVTIIATGLMVSKALNAAKELMEEGIDARVINIHTIKPIDKDIIIKASKETGAIVTCEEHSVIGGLGSAVSEVICENAPCVIRRVGVKDVFGCSGKPVQLFEKFGLDEKTIIKNVKDAINNK